MPDPALRRSILVPRLQVLTFAATLRHATRGTWALSTVLVAFSLPGCPGSLDPSLVPQGGGTGAAGTGGSGAGTGGTPPPPCDPAPAFKAHLCANAGCHDAMGTSANFDMASSDWETRLVGVKPKGGGTGLASKCGDLGAPYLEPGKIPATGLFLDKLKPDSTPPCGDVMPVIGAKLTSTDVDCIQSWANSVVMKGASTPADGGNMSTIGDGGTK